MWPTSRRPASKKSLWLSLGIVVLGLVVVYIATISLTQPVKYDLRVDEVAQQTITATKDVEDTVETEKRRQDARDKVQRSFITDNAITNSILQSLDSVFAAIEDARGKFVAYKDNIVKNSQAFTPETPVDERGIVPDPSLYQKLRDDILLILDPEASTENSSTISIPDAQLRAVIMTGDADYTMLRNTAADLMRAVLTQEDGLRESNVEAALASLRTDLGMSSVINELQPFANNVIFRNMLKANSFYDEAATTLAREAAASAVEPVIYKKGQNIVPQGERLKENHIAMLEALGLLQESRRPDMALYIGMAIILVLLGMTACMNLWESESRESVTPKRALLLVTVLIIELVASLAMRQIDVYLMPMHFMLIVIAVLMSPRIALSLNLLLGVIIGVFAAGTDGVFSASMIEILIVSQLGGTVAAFSLSRAQKRTSLLLAGLWTGLTSAAAMISIGLMTNLNIESTLKHAGFVALGSMLSSVLAVGFLPLLESVFSIMTQQKLLELSNPNQKLLRQLQLEAPGTYHHALLVANLAEAAADAVGANALLCRVGAYYHDIGKVKRPLYFKENQLDDVNPHDSMSPQVSAAILAEHVRDGRLMAEREKLPKPIIDIIMQHHGTTTMAYFLYRAQKFAEETGEDVSPEDFRYDGPIPQTKESAIIFLADSVEAAVRSLKDHSSENTQALIRKLDSERMQDGQLADVPLTLSDFHKIEMAFIRVLGGIYHTRVEYPELDRPKKKEEAI